MSDQTRRGVAGSWHAREAPGVARELDSTPSGLTEQEAAERLRRFGRNTLPEAPAPSDLELDRGASLAQAQSVALTTLILFQTFQLANVRSERRSIVSSRLWSNPFLFVSALVALGIHAAALQLPWTQVLLGVEPVSLNRWLIILLTATTVVIAVELHKAWLRRSAST